jgi:hypothetical protein
MSRTLLAAAVGGWLASTAVAADAAKPAAKKIDVVICLDVSNSMDGLIASAKLKLWDIVNDFARAKPAADLRVGLYSYGHNSYDRNAGWVRKELDLSTDLDALYQKLTGLTTRGGEEYVARVCRDALDQQKWAEEKDALRLIFVCGNESADQDKQVSLKQVADLATAKGVVVNTIFCGPAATSDATSWKHLADLVAGRFGSIDQDRGTLAIATPLDKQLAELSEKLNTTYVVYGGQAGQEKAELQRAGDVSAKKAAAKSGAPAAAAAARAGIKAGRLYRNESWDLVDRCKNDPKFDLKALKKEELSPELQKLTPAQLEAHVKQKAAEREALQKQVADLSAKRADYIRQEQKKNPSASDKAFDAVMRKTIREQAAVKGIAIPE